SISTSLRRSQRTCRLPADRGDPLRGLPPPAALRTIHTGPPATIRERHAATGSAAAPSRADTAPAASVQLNAPGNRRPSIEGNRRTPGLTRSGAQEAYRKTDGQPSSDRLPAFRSA